ncbi:MAG: FAD-dependent oxidoreductase [Bacilli bacterium]|nr:FAD-dependent oxidoreductase [Bacilli bacterium]
MKEIYKPLFTPWKIGNVEISNRIVMTSMGGTSIFGWMEPCHFDKEAAKFLLDKAKNNVGLVLPGIAPIRDPMCGRWLYTNKGMFKKLKKFMVEFHKTDSKMFVQLTAGFGRSFAINDLMEKAGSNKLFGLLLKPILDVDFLTRSASPNPNRWSDKVPSKEMTKKQINKMIMAFAKTAKLCKDAGVDGVEIHAVHEGYLLDQFTMKYTNQRTDEYGGSFENRYRFPVEIVKAIKKLCGDDYPVTLRYSVVSKTKGFRMGALPGEKYVEVGRDMEESERAAKYLQDAGYDMLNCDNGTYDAWYWAHPPGYMPQNCNLEEVEHIKKFVDIPVVCAGRMTPEVAAKAIAEGKLDGMGVARQFLTDSSWVKKLMADKEEEIRPCICCHNGCFNLCHYNGVSNDQDLGDAIHMARCALNPETMQSKKYYLKPAKKMKNIAVIGGGIGGMEVARVAAMRGHKVTIYEKSSELGGVFIAAAAPSFKEKDRELIEWYKREINSLPIEVKLNTEIKDIKSLNADKVVIATGAKPRVLHVPGAEKTIEACEYLLGKKEVGNKVVIVGGGLTGCEIAYDLFLKGKTPIIVEMKSDLIAVKGVCLANSSYLRDFFALNKVETHLETALVKVTDKGVVVKDKEGKEFEIEADSVISSIGYVPSPLAKGKLVGDCNEVGNLRTVIWGAWDVAMKL